MDSTLARLIEVPEFDTGSEPDFRDDMLTFCEVAIEEYEKTPCSQYYPDGSRGAVDAHPIDRYQ